MVHSSLLIQRVKLREYLLLDVCRLMRTNGSPFSILGYADVKISLFSGNSYQQIQEFQNSKHSEKVPIALVRIITGLNHKEWDLKQVNLLRLHLLAIQKTNDLSI